MSSRPETPQKKSRAQTTVSPYRIPHQFMDQTKNLKTMLKRDKLIDDKSIIEHNFFKTKFENNSQTDSSRYELRPAPKPKIQNKLHLQLPLQQTHEVKRYVGEQKQFQQTTKTLFSKIFSCCLKPQPQDDYQQCEYCQERYYNSEDPADKKLKEQRLRQITQPYISYRRLTQREKQPIQVFYQEITNQEIKNNRYQTNDDGLFKSRFN